MILTSLTFNQQAYPHLLTTRYQNNLQNSEGFSSPLLCSVALAVFVEAKSCLLIVSVTFIVKTFSSCSKLRGKYFLTFTATRYLPPYTPHVGPLDPVTFKEATLFTCIRVH